MQVNPSIVCREEFDGTGILFNPDDGKIYGLNATGLAIWRALENGGISDVKALVAELGKYSSEPLPESAESEIEAFVAELRSKSYLSVD